MAEEKDPNEERFTALEKQVQTLGSNIEKLVGALESQSSEDDDPPPKKKEEEFNIDDIPDQDLENMGRKDFLKLISKMTGSQVSQVVNDLSGKLEKTEGKISQTELKNELKDAMGKHPELPFFAEELKAMIKDNPGLSVERMVTLIKSENPEKLKQVQEKIAEENKEGDGEGEEGKEGKEKEGAGKEGAGKAGESGGGMAPGGGGSSGTPAEEGKMSMREAVVASMAEVGLTDSGE